MITEIKQCKNCPLYGGMPFGPLVGVGKKSDVFVISEFPSKEDAEIDELLYDHKGLIVRKLLQGAGITEYYLSSLIRCTPVGPTTKNSIKKCFDWIDKELDIIKPKVIVTLGHNVTFTLLKDHINKTDKIQEYAGNIYNWRSYKVIPIPAAHYLYMRGKKELLTAITQLKKIKGIINDI